MGSCIRLIDAVMMITIYNRIILQRNTPGADWHLLFRHLQNEHRELNDVWSEIIAEITIMQTAIKNKKNLAPSKLFARVANKRLNIMVRKKKLKT